MTSADSRTTDPAQRWTEIDALKLAGIVTIVLIHVLRPPWNPHLSSVELWLGHFTRFGVPAFLLASGFLYASREPSPTSVLRRRLRRILIPYAVASIAAHLLGAAEKPTGDPWAIARDLAIGSTFGPFYYVFVIAGLVLASPAFERLSARGLAALTLASVALQFAVDVFKLQPFHLTWQLRSPLLWWGYYLVGWWLRLYGGEVRAFARRHSTVLAACAVSLTIACALIAGAAPDAYLLFSRGSAWLGVWAILGGIWVLATPRTSAPWMVRLSDATYTVFLYHMFFVLPLRRMLPLPPDSVTWLSLAVPWIVGFAAPLVMLALARAVLGARSRLVFGA